MNDDPTHTYELSPDTYVNNDPTHQKQKHENHTKKT